MTSDDELRELRRAAFGKTSTPAEQREAAQRLATIEADRARAEREQVEQERAAAGHIHADTELEHLSPPLAADATPHDNEHDVQHPRHGMRAIWLAPIVLASLAVGAIGGSVWGATHQSTASPSAHTSFALGTDGSGQPGGDLAAAERTLAQPQTTQDVYPLPALVQNLRQSSVRRLGGPDETVQTWVGRNTEDELCLLVYESKTRSGAASCATTADFTSHAITLGFNQYQVSWDGTKATVFMPYGS